MKPFAIFAILLLFSANAGHNLTLRPAAFKSLRWRAGAKPLSISEYFVVCALATLRENSSNQAQVNE